MRPDEILELRPGATRAEVSDAFRRFARRHHPDHGGDALRFQAGLEAYRRLMGAGASAGAHPRAGAHVVFHRRSRPGIPSLLRLARRRLGSLRPRPY